MLIATIPMTDGQRPTVISLRILSFVQPVLSRSGRDTFLLSPLPCQREQITSRPHPPRCVYKGYITCLDASRPPSYHHSTAHQPAWLLLLLARILACFLLATHSRPVCRARLVEYPTVYHLALTISTQHPPDAKHISPVRKKAIPIPT